MSDRPETGPMRFGDDWTGVFIRGDHASYYALSLCRALECDALPPLTRSALSSLYNKLSASNMMRGDTEPQRCRPWAECEAKP